jgi:hypothetical protein
MSGVHAQISQVQDQLANQGEHRQQMAGRGPTTSLAKGE